MAISRRPWYLRASKRMGIMCGVLFLVVGMGVMLWRMNAAYALTLQDGMVAHWKLDEASEGTAADSSGNGHDGTPTGDGDGGVLPQPSTNVPTVDFTDSRSLDFDGNDDAVTTNLSLNGTAQFTAAGWIYPTAAGNRMSFFGQNDGLEFGFSDSTHIACYVGNSGSSTTVSWAFTSETFPLNQWHHVACTNTGSAQVLYVDGTAVATASVAVGTANSPDTFALGAGAWDPLGTAGGNFNGNLDDVYVYDRVLNAAEISQLMTLSDEEPALTLQGGSNVANEIGTPAAITDLQVAAASGNPNVPVKLLVSHGTLAMATTTGLTFYNANGTTGGPQTGSTLYFSGTLSNVNAALATLSYTRTGTGTDTVEASLVNPGEVFFAGTGGTNHLYEYVSVPGNITWTNAKTAAEARTKYGAQGYLTTIASPEENQFVADRLLNAGWMGASDTASEGAWRWVAGPETGTQFCQGNNPCNSVDGGYTNWNTGEPNDTGGEDCGQFLAGGTGKWNDLPCGSTLPGYVVEYGAPGDMPEVAAKNITITTSDTTPPSLAGTVTIPASPTTDTTPTLSWNAATDGGVGLASPAYRLEWSASATFAGYTPSGSNSLTASGTSATVPAGLADGAWYFRVVATDQASNATMSAISSPLVIDTTSPTAGSLSPADNAVNVAVNSPLVITFDAAVQKGAGSITVKRAADDSVVETVNVSSGAVTVSSDTVTVGLSAAFAYDTGYYVEVSSGAFEDMAGNSSGGIAGASAWNFTTTKTPSQVALEKIQTYADTSGSSSAPTVGDYANAGVTGVTAGNLATMNSFVAGSGTASFSLAQLQTLAVKAIAFDKIVQYADTDGASAAPTVTDYADAGIAGVTAANLAAVNAAVASSDPAQLASLSALQSFVGEAVAAASQAGEQTAPNAPNTGFETQNAWALAGTAIAGAGLLAGGVTVIRGGKNRRFTKTK